MKSYRLPLGIFLLFFISQFSFAQDFQGVAVYQTKTTMDMSNWGRADMTEEQKKRIADRMRSMLEKTYELRFSKSESMYKEEEKLEAPGSGPNRWGAMMGSFSNGAQYKNVQSKQLLQEQEFFGKQFLIKDELQPLEWVMGTETKQIGKYLCFKATAVQTVDEFDWTKMRRRGPEEKPRVEGDSTASKKEEVMPEVPKGVTVVAWYTPQIPVSQGPETYWGLPGLILELTAGNKVILCSKIVINPEEKQDIKVPTKGKEVTKKEYNEIVEKKVTEMREMYRGRGGQGRPRG
ncbi:MAG: ribonuclease Z [Bacteroidetes bacterium MedPE-SWsnd-G2]|nr:MAG: ribonuclease Z [Bacteroidetes bacterium MedPE-SWsnd-G2]